MNRNRDELQVVNLDRLQYWVDTGRLDTDRMLTMRDLVVLIPPILSELIELHRRVVRLVVPSTGLRFWEGYVFDGRTRNAEC